MCTACATTPNRHRLARSYAHNDSATSASIPVPAIVPAYIVPRLCSSTVYACVRAHCNPPVTVHYCTASVSCGSPLMYINSSALVSWNPIHPIICLLFSILETTCLITSRERRPVHRTRADLCSTFPRSISEPSSSHHHCPRPHLTSLQPAHHGPNMTGLFEKFCISCTPYSSLASMTLRL